MKNINKRGKIFLALGLLLIGGACKDLTELNVNPNGVEPNEANPNLVMPYVLSEAPKNMLNLSLGITSGIMQHTQLDGWFGAHNGYYFGTQDWKTYYGILSNNKLVYDRSVELGFEFHQGVALVMKSMLFGLITDLWGDAPYSTALNGEKMGEEDIRPTFDSQESIYSGIIDDLETANALLSKKATEYVGIDNNADLIYGGDPAKWRKLANSLQLRFYMRISSKKPDVSKAGIEKIVSDPAQYPIITNAADDALLSFPGTSVATSWPTNITFDLSESGYSRIKMDSVLVGALLRLDDPRIGIYAEKVQIPLVVDPSLDEGTDRLVTVDGKTIRELSTDKAESVDVPLNTNPDYVGLPTQLEAPGAYNLNPNASQGAYNPHVSQLNKMYKEKNGSLLKVRILTAAEVNFILAEAKLKGWNVGDAQTHYEAAVKASFDSWELTDDYSDYITGDAAYNGTLEQLMEQKWIASWTNATEAWFDYRRTGLPVLKTTEFAFRSVLPVRFPYGDSETGQNEINVTDALNKLKTTKYTQSDGMNSSWSKPWLLKDTGKPWED